ncbi:methyltransferase domain-containing protein [Paenibacillus sp. IB182496]|uniref:Methyltransferase domain-containing protein n=1 Tax=Paenibacillus sabuli TaxID=2772509 RepID=A0A927GU03_9BACL|nr:methyltransferase domain-containing protein [Paenibacillus sabuli]MBD2847635.1 methyltransferase domain-containing protein [Paenibacillus sabuli]
MTSAQAQKEVWDRLWSNGVNYSWDALSQTIYDKLQAIVGEPEGRSFLEAGSGTGKISLRLGREGATVLLVDYSEQAIDNSRGAFARAGVRASFVQSDIRSIPLPDAAVDVAWNAGVLEHFDDTEKVRIVREMARVTKPGGHVIILTPCAACLPYRIGKAYAEQQGSWPYGIENPVASLGDVCAAGGVELIEESSIGFTDGLAFLDFIGGAQPVKQALQEWYAELSEEERSAFPGYLLVSAARTPIAAERADEPSAATEQAPRPDAKTQRADEPIAEGSSLPDQTAASRAEAALRGLALSEALERLREVQETLSRYHKARAGGSHYLEAYREQEASYWLPLLPILDALLARPGARVLDVGAAYGTLILYSALAGASCRAVDTTDAYWSPELEREHGIGWSRCNIEADELPGDEPCDIILFTEVLEQLRYNPIPVLRKLTDRLTPGGSLLLSTPWKRYFAPNQASPDLLEMPLYSADTPPETIGKFYSSDELYALAGACGLAVPTLQIYNGRLLAWLKKA